MRTTALPDGFTGKVGRFFSGFGYLNEVHAHAWDFVDQPLVYQAMFGGQSRQEGVQVKWLAPTDLFVEFGAEVGNGDSYPSTRGAGNGLNATTLFAHVGGDVGDYTSWRQGSPGSTATPKIAKAALRMPPARRCSRPSPAIRNTWVVDGVLKWAPSPRRQLKVQGEYMHREESGDDRRRRRSTAGRRLSQHAVRLVPAERLSIRAALARGRALRLAGFGHAALHAGA